jgi:hypothetical protein
MEKKDFENYLQATATKKVDKQEFIEKEFYKVVMGDDFDF